MISQLNNLLVKMTYKQENTFLKTINLAEPFIKKIINEGNSEELKLINDYIINFFDIDNYTYKTIKLTKHFGKQSIFRMTIKYLIKIIPFTNKYYNSREAYLVHLKNKSEYYEFLFKLYYLIIKNYEDLDFYEKLTFLEI